MYFSLLFIFLAKFHEENTDLKKIRKNRESTLSPQNLKDRYKLAFVYLCFICYFLFLWNFNILLRARKIIFEIYNSLILHETKRFNSEFLKIFIQCFIYKENSYQNEKNYITNDFGTPIILEFLLIILIIIPNLFSFLNYISQLKRFFYIKDYISAVFFNKKFI